MITHPFLRNLGLTLGGRGISLGANLGYLVITARHFTKQEVAVLALSGILLVLMDALKGLGLGTILIKDLPKLPAQGDAHAASLVLSFLAYSLLSGLVFTVAAIAAVPVLASHVLDNPVYATSLRLGICWALFQVLTNSTMLVVQARQQFGQLALQTIQTSLLQKLIPALAAFSLGWNLEKFLACSAILAALALVISFAPLLRVSLTPGAALLNPSAFWWQSRNFYFAGLIRHAATQLDQVIVAGLFSPAVLAVYYMIRRLYSMAVLLVSALIDILTPDLSREAGQSEQSARRRLTRWMKVAFLAGIGVAAFLAGNGEWLVGLLLGPGYAEDPWLATLFCLAAFGFLLFSFGQVDLLLFREPSLCLRMAVVAAGLNSLLSPLLAAAWGVKGLPLAMASSYLVSLELFRRGGHVAAWSPLTTAAGSIAIAMAGALSWVSSLIEGTLLRTGLVNAMLAAALLILAYGLRSRYWPSQTKPEPTE